jgi:hypothetical protein
MTTQTNIDILIAAGAIDSADSVSPEHRDLLNAFTQDEINAVIKLQQQIIGQPLASDPGSSGGAIL